VKAGPTPNQEQALAYWPSVVQDDADVGIALVASRFLPGTMMVLTLATNSTLSMISVLVAKTVLVEATLTVFVEVDAVTVSLFSNRRTNLTEVF
jgi:hypothetical protein